MSFKDFSKIEETIPKKDLSNKQIPDKTGTSTADQPQTGPTAQSNSGKPETE